MNTDKLFNSADIVFLNADAPDALTQWQAFSEVNKQATPIMVTSDTSSTTDGLVLDRPLSIKKLMSALRMVTSTDKAFTSGAEDQANTTQHILVVDDSFSVRKFMECKLPELSAVPIVVEFAESGEAAMDKIKRQSFDLVFLDVVMPGIDGYQVCKWIKSEQPTYVVMLTSKKSPFDKVRGSMSGCNAYITKPPKDDRLQKVLEKSVKANEKKNQTQALAKGFQQDSLLTIE
ncbi:MAG: response regulator [Gammaproteobacteria bacterium]